MLLNHRTLNIVLIDTPKKLILFDKLNHQAKVLLVITGIYSLSWGLSSVFITLYLYKAATDFFPPLFFNLGTYIALVFGFISGGLLLRKVSINSVLALSFFLFSIFYTTVVILGEKSASVSFLLGLFYGYSGGFFWLVRHLLEYETTYDGNRNRFFAAAYILATLASIIAPLMAGFLIVAGEAQHYSGYLIVFGVSAVLMLATGILSFFLKREAGLEFKLIDLFRLHKYNPDWFSIEITQFVQGLKEGCGPVLVTLATYIILKNELDVGGAISLGAAIAMVVGFVMGKFTKSSQRVTLGWLGAFFAVLAYLVFTLNFNITSLVAYILIISISAPALYIVFDSFPVSTIDSDPKGRERRAIYTTSSEIWWNLGRVISVLSFLVLISLFNPILSTRYFLFATSFFLPIIIFLYSRFNSTA